MELNVYNGEYFERNKTRYIVFFLIVGAVIIASILSNNIIGAVIILLFVGGYFYFLTQTNEEITLKIEKGWLLTGPKFHPRNKLQGFVLEYHTKTQNIHNIVLLYTRGYEIYTINDSTEKLQEFSLQLDQNIPLLESYEQSIRDKFMRKVKL